MAVNRENIQLWVDALESGEFTQGTGVLRANRRDESGDVIGTDYCCLGVACKIAERNGIKNPTEPEENWYSNYGTLPDAVRAWLGFETPNPMLGGETATTVNDLSKESFAQIAARTRSTYLNQ